MLTGSALNGHCASQYSTTERSHNASDYMFTHSPKSSISIDVDDLDHVPSTNSNTMSIKEKINQIDWIIDAIIMLIRLLVVVAVLFFVHSTNSVGSTTAAAETSLAPISTSTTSVTTTTTTTSTSSTTTTQNPYLCSNMTILVSYDLGGSDIISRNLTNYTLCCAWCRSYTGCKAFTWGLSTAGWAAFTCFLKKAVPTRSANSVLVSAYF